MEKTLDMVKRMYNGDGDENKVIYLNRINLPVLYFLMHIHYLGTFKGFFKPTIRCPSRN